MYIQHHYKQLDMMANYCIGTYSPTSLNQTASTFGVWAISVKGAANAIKLEYIEAHGLRKPMK